MSLARSVFAASLLTAVFAVGCTEPAPDGGFGEAKPMKDDGMVGRPQPLPEAPPDWNAALAVVPAFDQASQTLTVTLKIKPGFHAYGPGEEVSKPIAMSLKEGSSWSVDGTVNIPPGVQKDLGALGKSVILEGDVVMTAKLKPGAGAIEGIVEAQVCTEKACDRPRKHPITIPTT